MRLLADENFPGDAVAALRAAGHDVAWVAEIARSIPDTEVLRLAREQERVLLTSDKDFGDLAFRVGLLHEAGIVLFRLPAVPSVVAAATEHVFRKHQDFKGKFLVVEPHRIRERRMP